MDLKTTRKTALRALSAGPTGQIALFKRALMFSASALTLGAMLPGDALAAQVTWLGTASADWTTAGNWNGGVPTASDGVTIDTITPNGTGLSAGAAGTGDIVTVGDGAAGQLLMDTGSTLSTLGVILAGQATGNGTVVINDAMTELTATSNIIAGYYGTGVLGAYGGGSLKSAAGYVGFNPGANGTATVDGAGSQWAMTGYLYVGDHGTGTLKVSDSGKVTSGHSYIGYFSEGSGTVTVDGAGSTWGVTGNVYVGNFGTGTLSISNGGSATNLAGYVGYNSGSNGTVTVDGTGSSWTSTADVNIGFGGTGKLLVLNGGAVTSGAGRIGRNAGSDGAATIDGTSSSWTLTGALVVGFDGKGVMTVSNGGAVAGTYGTLGYSASALGSATLDGAGSSWVLTNDLYVGSSGTGVLTVSNGGSASLAGGRVFAGDMTGSSGQVYVSGQGSSIASNGLAIGNAGQGELTIVNGGDVIGGAGFNSFVGEGVGGAGTVTIDGAGSSWTGTDNLFLGRGGTGTLTVSDGALFTANGLILADDPTGIANLNIGAAAGVSAKGAGTLSAATLKIGDGVGTLNFNHTDANYTFAADISSNNASASINQISGVTRLTGNSSGFTGTMTLSGGSLYVNGTLGGAINVIGGSLGGSGKVGAVTLGSGGTVAPGNSIGTLNVANFTVASGSVYAVEVDSAGNSDLIDATGTVTINGGRVSVVPYPDYALNTNYTIVTAAGGVTGTFADADFAKSAFIDPLLTYDANNVYMQLIQSSFASAAQTPNQNAAANGAQSLGAGNALYDAVNSLTTKTEARGAFDQLSGEVHASVRTALIEDSRFVREAALDRIRQAFAASEDARTGIWMHGFGVTGQIDGDGNAARLDRTTGGFFIGANGEVINDWVFGVLAGYSHSSFNVDDRASSGAADSYHLGAYGGGAWNNVALRFGGAYSWHDISTGRSVAFTGFSDSLAAEYWAGTGQFFGELAYGLDAGTAHLEPFANLAWVSQTTRGFTEKGGSAALTGSNDVTNATFTTLGVRASTELVMGESARARLSGTAGWRHGFGGTPASTLAFAGGSSFIVAGVPLAMDTLVIETGLNFQITPSATLGLDYSGQIGAGIVDHTFKANLGVNF